MSNSRWLVTSVASLLAMWVLSGCIVVTGWGFGPKHWIEATEEIVLPAASVDELSAKTRNGSIKIQGVSDSNEEIVVKVKIKAGGSSAEDAQDCLDAIHIETRREDGVQKVSWIYTREKRNSWSAAVSFDVSLPGNTAVTSRTHNGAVVVSRVHGSVEATTHNGKMTLDKLSGSVRGETHNGAIVVDVASDDVHLLTHNGGIKARIENYTTVSGSIETHNGGVQVSFAGNPSTQVRCKTHNGGISHQDLGFTSFESTKRSLTGKLGSGRGRLKLETHNGSIRLRNDGIDRSL